MVIEVLVKNFHVLFGKLLGGSLSTGKVTTGNPFRRLLQLREHKRIINETPDW